MAKIYLLKIIAWTFSGFGLQCKSRRPLRDEMLSTGNSSVTMWTQLPECPKCKGSQTPCSDCAQNVSLLKSASSQTSHDLSNGSAGPVSPDSDHHASAPIPTFRRGDKTDREKDIKRLAIAFTLAESNDLRNIFSITARLINVHCKGTLSTAKVVQFMETCAPFIFRLGEIYINNVGEPSSNFEIKELLRLLQDLDRLCSSKDVGGDERDTERLISDLCNKISGVKKIHPSEFEDIITEESGQLQSRVDYFLDASVTILDMIRDGSDLIPPVSIKPAVSLACALMKAVKKTRANYQDMHDLAEVTSEFVLSISVFSSDLNNNPSHTFERALTDFIATLHDIVISCLHLAERSLVSRFLQQGKDAEVLVSLKFKLDHAISEFQLKTQLLQHSDFQNLTKFIADRLDGDLVQSLPVNVFFQGSRADFLPDIQDDILEKIGCWIEDSPSPLLLLVGSAGLGKTSIAHQLVYHLMDTGRLAGQIFFTRGSVTQSSLVTVIQTLAHELSVMHPRTIPAIANAIRQGGSSHESLASYLTKYILEPIKSLSLRHPLVLVLDALDECGNYQLLLKAFSGVDNSLASTVKIIITSRPSHIVQDTIDTVFAPATKLNLECLTQSKMERYITDRFGKIDWNGHTPSKDDIAQLARHANGLLVWAATACNLIGNEMQEDEPHELLHKVISSRKSRDITSEDQLATLYHTTLLHLFGKKNVHDFVQVFQAMLVVQESMPLRDFSTTFNISARQAKAIHSSLCALEIYRTHDNSTIIPATQRFHASFLEYIAQPQFPSHSNPFCVDLSLAHSSVANQCISQMLELSAHQNDLKKLAYDDLDRPVQYAACHWPYHLITSVRIRNLSATAETHLLKTMAEEGLKTWSPFYLLTSQEISTILEGQGARRVETIDKAITFHTHSLQLFSAVGVEQTEALSDFGLALWKRYDQCGSLKDLEDAISMQSSFLNSHPEPSGQRAQALSRMGVNLWARFMTAKSSSDDLDKSISVLNDALKFYSSIPQNDFATLSALAVAVRTRFEETGTSQDLDYAIELHQKVAGMTPPSHIDSTRAQNNLAICLISRFEERAMMVDLDEAISILRDILQRRPAGHPYRSSTLNNLAYSLQHRFEKLGCMPDLEDAIDMNYEVLESRPAPHQYRAQSLTNIALCLRHRYHARASESDLQNAISMDAEAVELRPAPHPYRALSLSRLGSNLRTRFQHGGDPADLQEAIASLTSAVELCPDDHRDCFIFLNDLASALRARFKEGAAKKDLEDALSMQRKALRLSPPQGLGHADVLNDLGETLLTQYEHRQSKGVLDEAIGLFRQSMELRPAPHPYRFQSLNGLARALRHKFERTYQTEDLDEACDLYAESDELCPPGHPSRSIALEGLECVAQSRLDLHDPLAILEEHVATAVQPRLSLLPKM